MNADKKLERLLAAGYDTNTAAKLAALKLTPSKLKSATREDLKGHFPDWEIDGILAKVRRQPIPEKTVAELVEKADWKCCVCWDYRKEDPVIIHHVIEHSRSRDDSYDNLVLLCLNHHGLAHSRWEITQHPLPVELLRIRKAEWEKAVSEYRAGTRPLPGGEQDRFSQSDVEALRHLRAFFDRPALHQPFEIEGNMKDFMVAVTDMIRAINAGVLKTGEGDEITHIKGRGFLSNPNWQQKLDLVAQLLENLRTRFQLAIRNGELHIDPETGFYDFRDRTLPDEIDAMRDSIVLLFNEVLVEAGLRPLNGVRPWRRRW